MPNHIWLFARSATATVLLPGMVAVCVPYSIVQPIALPTLSDWRWTDYFAVLAFAMGLAILLRCVWEFAHFGRGTLAPVDEPCTLVVQGLYQYVRNPMYVGVVLIILGESWFFRSAALLVYVAVVFVVFNAFVLIYEEPHLRSKYDSEYKQYCGAVRRWIPGRSYLSLAEIT